MATLREIRDHLLEHTDRDMFEPHPLYEDIIDLILEGAFIGEITDYANLLTEIRDFCDEQLEINGFRDQELIDEENPNQ